MLGLVLPEPWGRPAHPARNVRRTLASRWDISASWEHSGTQPGWPWALSRCLLEEYLFQHLAKWETGFP